MKNRLIAKMCAFALAGTIATIGLTGCGASNENLNELSSSLTDDAGVVIIDAWYADLSIEENEYIVKFLGHTEDGNTTITSSGRDYKNHKDYWIKYSVSREDYIKIAQSGSITSYRFRINNNKDCELLQSIIDNYDPIETTQIEEVDRNHSY